MDVDQYKKVIESELFRIGPIVALIWENKENWPIYGVSKNMESIYGHKESDLLSGALLYENIVHKDDVQRAIEELDYAEKSGIVSYQHKPYRIMCKDGSFKWVQDTTIVLREAGKVTHYIGYLNDITALKKLEHETALQNATLLKHQALFRSYKIAMDESSIVSKADLQGNITFVNEKFCEISGYTKEEVLGKSHGMLRTQSTTNLILAKLWKTIKAKKVWKGVLLNKGKYHQYWVDISILPILDENDEIVEYIAVRHDITKMMEQQQKLDALANTDTLTGYGNRYKLNRDIHESKQPALAILNIDDFSQINDFYGHVKGDRVIQLFGDMIQKSIQEDICELYHLQGDEFVILNPDTSKEAFIDKIRDVLTEIKVSSVKIKGEDYYLSVRTALSFEEKENILITADMALKIAKMQNKSLVVYNESISLNSEYENNLKWRQKIKEAIESDRIVPVFQPIVNNVTNKWEKYESLVRMEDLDGTLISPAFFLEISKKTKHYSSITKIMLKKSFEMFQDREEEFSVNITVEDILSVQINTYIFYLLDEYKIGNRLVFEIVESESIENFEEIVVFIKQVKSYGAKVAIDDFGTGYSNFEYLLRLKADYIKVDGSMIKNIDTNKDAQLVVSTIVDFAKKMGMQTIAEFVENESVYKTVKELGIDYTQGYYFSKPLAII